MCASIVNQLLPSVFQSFFIKLYTVHSYHSRHSAKQSYYLPKARTNYGKFNIRFQGPKIWNAIDYDIKHLPISSFKIKLKQSFLQSYCLVNSPFFLLFFSHLDNITVFATPYHYFSDIRHCSVQIYFLFKEIDYACNLSFFSSLLSGIYYILYILYVVCVSDQNLTIINL